MWNILNKNRCETLADIFRDAIKFNMDFMDVIIKILNSDYKDQLEAGDLICISRGSLYYLSWIEEKNKIDRRTYGENELKYYMTVMEWMGYLLQSWYEDFNVTGKEITKNLGTEDFLWLIDNFGILHTQDTKYVIHEMERVRDIKLIDEQV